MKKSYIILGILALIILTGASCQNKARDLNGPIDQAQEGVVSTNQPIDANSPASEGTVQGDFDEKDYLDEALVELDGVGED